jgi:hypothetical protein
VIDVAVRSLSRVLAVCVVLFGMTGRAAAQQAETTPDQTVPRIVITVPPPPSRPAALIPMYIALGGLQAFDGYSTIHGGRSGGVEQNPLVGGLAARPAAFWAIKGASTFTTIYFAERLWRDGHKTEAIVTMIVANGVMGVVAARNASFLRTH